MSRKQRSRRGGGTVTRTAPRQPNIRPGGQNFVPISDKVVNAMYQHLAPQSNQGYMYVPGAPIRPIPGLTPPGGPRGWEYPIGYNIAQLPRSTEAYSFADLRSLAQMYYGIQICQQVWFDYISKLELVIEPRPDLVEENRDISEYATDIQYYKEFFAYPDKEHDLHSWLQMAVRDQLEIDAVAIYVRKNKIGLPYALELLDGATIKPLINDRGRRPDPTFPAFEQFVYGVPACFLTSDDLIYIKETERTDSVYGMSRVEKIILNVNVALRKQTKDLARFTDGTVPQGVLQPSVDVTWSQEEIEAYELQFNNLMAGNDELRARVKVLPRGFEYQATDDPDIHVDLDTYLLNITASNYGITMSELAFTQDVNRSTGEMQENVVYRRAMGPLMVRYAKLFTGILRKYFQENRFIVRFAGFGEVEDFRSRAQAYATLTNAGIISPSRAAHEMNLPVDVDLPSPLLNTKNGPMLLEDFVDPSVREGQKQAIIAAGTPPEPATPQTVQPESEETDEEPPEDSQKAPKPRQGSAQPAKKAVGKPQKAARREADALLLRVADALERLELRIDGKQFVGIPRNGSTSKEQTGMMLAFRIDPEVASQLALPGGEDPSELHCTLAFLGDMRKIQVDVEALKQAVADFASSAPPLTGKTGGVGRFTSSPSSDGKSPVIALVNAPGLQAWRQALVEHVEQAGVQVAKDFDYTPHITLAYVPDGAPMPIEQLPALPLTFESIILAIGGECTQFPLQGSQLVKRDEEPDAGKEVVDDEDTGQDDNEGEEFPSDTRVLTGEDEDPEDLDEDDEQEDEDQETSDQDSSWIDQELPEEPEDEPITPTGAKSAPPRARVRTRTQAARSGTGATAPAAGVAENDDQARHPRTATRTASDDYRSWRTRAIADVKAGRALRGFTTTLIPEYLHTFISRELVTCTSADAVRSVFARARNSAEEKENDGH